MAPDPRTPKVPTIESMSKLTALLTGQTVTGMTPERVDAFSNDISTFLDPDEVFTLEALLAWAVASGYVLADAPQ